MKLVDGLIDYTKAEDNHLLLATTNNVVGKSGLVMGRGNALSMKQAHPKIPNVFGEIINHNKYYGLVIEEVGNYFLGAFQTKEHWRSDSTLDLIKYSTEKLMSVSHCFEAIHLPMPGVNNGKLDKYIVLEQIYILPDNVFVYH